MAIINKIIIINRIEMNVQICESSINTTSAPLLGNGRPSQLTIKTNNNIKDIMKLMALFASEDIPCKI